ncbi:MAG: Sec-independent protein translocase subunit TatB [Betaproteobacteria bacterium]|nr:Sec-independent protein translocase subunit TatB [Betaproteobacteria bacterium]
MFDISLFEMVVIGVVALIVIGPERLPGVARTAGHLFGRMQRYVNDVKSDIQREIELDELKKLRESVQDSAREIEQSMSRELDQVDQEMRELKELVEPSTQRQSEDARSEDMQPAAAALLHTPASKPDAAPDTAPERDIAPKPDTTPNPDTAPETPAAARPGMPAEAPKSA